ncbi:MAG: NAD-dependent epimerase/dehydratase family protein [Solirubrobacteraceae bacterium]
MSQRPTTLITGGAGFIGSTLARRLADEGHRVVLADVRELSAEGRFTLGERCDDIELVRLSVDAWAAVMEALARTRPDHVVHVAAITNPVYLERNPLAALRVNVEGTFNVLEAARQHGARSVVFFSSIGALPTVQYEPIDAAHPTILAREGPGSGFYGASKLAGEAFALSYAAAFGLDIRVVRPSAVYGLGMNWPIYIKPMVEGAVRGEPVRFDSGAAFPRDYTNVEDVAGLTAALLRAPADADRVFYAATGEPLVTAGELAGIVRELVPGADIEIADRLSAADRLELRYRGRLSIENARAQLGWEPRYRSLAGGVRDYVARYRAFLARPAP